MQGVDAWPTHGSHKGDFDFGATVAECSAHVQQGFLRKVFGLVAAQLAATAALSAAFCFVTPVRDFALSTPSMILVSFFSAIVCLGLCASYKVSSTHRQQRSSRAAFIASSTHPEKAS